MGAGRGKTVNLRRLIPNPNIVRDRLITQVHDYDEIGRASCRERV